jgi:hypothetical protein
VRILFNNSHLVSPKVSIVLLDWSCRESFHILDYLQKQTVPRDQYEIIWIEYYNKKSPEIGEKLKHCERSGKPPVLDQWVIMDMPSDVYYHKHLMYNVGTVLSRGEVVTICDSDAIVRKTFVEEIVRYFEKDPNIVLHLDEVRNNNKRFYPFNYPTIEEAIGDGCINWRDGKTTGLWDAEDILHTRNYGACFAALRRDVISIGGADEHIDYLGHVCGPYDMTFRLVNSGKREVWHPDEFLYHVWHPGQAGDNNYIGPHDGQHVSSRALEARFSGRILPLMENPAIRKLRMQDGEASVEQSLSQLVSEERLESWSSENLPKLKPRLRQELFSCRRPVVAVRLCKTFFRLFIRQLREKFSNLRAKGRKSSDAARQAMQPGAATANGSNLARVYQFGKRMLEFCLYATHRSRECLNTLVAQGDHEVSFYGTDGVAEILYDLTFEIPVTVKNIYDDSGNRFHAFKVLPVEACRTATEKLIITSLVGIDKKLGRLKTLGVSPDRIVVLQ